jgi:pimeloyl-ACP methyl ester carboxylesterase
MKTIDAGVLRVAYHDIGPADGPVAILLHGFPYGPGCYDEVAARLAARGIRSVVPYLRGYGPTRFLSTGTPRSGEQAALGADLLALMDALGIGRSVLAGYDWGGRAACIVAALWPDRARGLVSGGAGYNIQDIARSAEPATPDMEERYWYQYYFHSERGRAGLERNRAALARHLWRLWSPGWAFSDAAFAATAADFDNPDFVEVVIHSYRHRFGLVAGDPAVAEIEARLAQGPDIGVPTIVLHGAEDGVDPLRVDPPHRARFTGPYERRVLPGIGHNPPQESPAAFAAAVAELV